MATTKGLLIAALAVALLGCGSGEDPSLSKPAEVTAGGTKGPEVTKATGEKMDQSSEAQAAAEERGG